MNTTFRQRRAFYKTTFDFGEEELTYTFDNSRSKVGSSIAYHKIPGRTSYRRVKLWWLKYVTVFYLTFCAVMAWYYTGRNDMETLIGTLYASTVAFLIVLLNALLLRHGGMTSFRLNPVLIVLQDAQQQTILDEIMKRRLEAMKKKLAQVDFNRPYYEEARKFNWLREEGVITEQEYRHARQKIAAMRGKAGSPPPGMGSMN
jgi:hypothetical protein